ncbi:MAG: copper chaperone PCu(A)C [Rhodospirillales bacterium]|nr:copper chaperone PCu(A)C [Rhodospirillales bacterium]
MIGRAALAVLLALAGGAAEAKTYKLEGLQIVDPVAPATPRNLPEGPVGATASLVIENKGTAPLQYLGASSPAAGVVELHQAVKAGKAIRTRRVLSLSLYPGDRIEVGPEAEYRLILTGVKQKLQNGDTFPLLLEFEPLGQVEVMVEVGGRTGPGSAGGKKDVFDSTRHNKTHTMGMD